MGLDPEFKLVKAKILSGASLSSFVETHSRVMRAAFQDSSVHLDPSQFALVSHTPSSHNDNRGNCGGVGRGRGRGGHGKGSRLWCTNCGNLGQTCEKCWDLIWKSPHIAHTTSSNTPTTASTTSKLP